MTNDLIGNLRNKRVLLTGGSGFIGRFLFSRIRPLCRDLRLYEKDVRDAASYKKRYDIVCHLAALNKPEDKKDEIREMFDVNVNGTLSIMRYCRRNDVMCVLASSSAVYEPSLSDRAIGEKSPLKPVSAYGISKVLAEQVCEAYSEDFGVRVMALRIFNVYGPGQKEPFLFPYLVSRIRKRKAVGLKTPMVVRDFIHISDVADAFLLACAHTWRGFVALNIGTGRGISVHEAARKIASLMKTKILFDKTLVISRCADYVIADTDSIKKFLNWRPSIDFENGLRFLCKRGIGE